MGQAERKGGIRARLRRAWDTALRAADVMSVSPMEDRISATGSIVWNERWSQSANRPCVP